MGLIYTSFKKKKRNRLPRTKSLLDARENHRKYLISLGIDPDRKINKRNFRVIPNWWEVGKSAAVAQQVEQLICNHQVGSSILSHRHHFLGVEYAKGFYTYFNCTKQKATP